MRTTAMLIIILIMAITACDGAAEKDDVRFAKVRREMVENQLRRRDITDKRVLAAMEKVERHRFVPDKYKAEAYDDEPLPIEAGQTISQPYVVALMTQYLNLTGKERVLEIGTGSGYQAAILGELANEVYTIEIIDTLGKSAAARLKELGYKNITVRIGDGYLGWPEKAPFDGIIVTCAVDHIPEALVKQLASGGRMIIPVGHDAQMLSLVEKKADSVFVTSVIPVRFVPMTGEGVREKPGDSSDH